MKHKLTKKKMKKKLESEPSWFDIFPWHTTRATMQATKPISCLNSSKQANMNILMEILLRDHSNDSRAKARQTSPIAVEQAQESLATKRDGMQHFSKLIVKVTYISTDKSKSHNFWTRSAETWWPICEWRITQTLNRPSWVSSNWRCIS